MKTKRRNGQSVLCAWLTFAFLLACIHSLSNAVERPNVIIIFADDLGYGDLGCYGSPTIRTPHLDRMASEGLRFTDFYSASEVCSPSRAALLTGRLPYSNDMDARADLPKGSSGSPTPPYDGWNVPLMRDGKIIEQPANQATLTKRYTEEAINFISEQKGKPFFLYFAHAFPHVPMFVSSDFKGKSRGGIFGDAVEELDWSVGQILDILRKKGIAGNTLVFFTSDNGPWLIMGDQGGSAGLLHEGKGSTWEGGMRVPGIAWMPSRIKPGVTSEVVHAMDLLPTALALAEAPVPENVTLDGFNLLPLLFESKPLPARPFVFYRGEQIFACRLGEWKAHFKTQNGYGQSKAEAHDPPLLFHLGRDPSERRSVAAEHADVIAQIAEAVKAHKAGIVPGVPQLQ
jgi:arylsulfatase A